MREAQDDLSLSPLVRAGNRFIMNARKYFDEQGVGLPPKFQIILDELPDHNQTMIDSINEASCDLHDTIMELMAHEDPAWCDLVNYAFARAEAIHGAEMLIRAIKEDSP